MKALPVLLRVIVCLLLAGPGLIDSRALAADSAKEEEVKADIVYLCYNQMGEFGAAGLDACVKAEQSAMHALSLYPQEHREIVQRCRDRMQPAGWQLVKSCVDKEIAAPTKKH